ncbi:MAG: HlyD family secretion protein [Proteobacteria bacterium]|nr:HlyD family secretion protein [Pseudomonadota bacterium]
MTDTDTNKDQEPTALPADEESVLNPETAGNPPTEEMPTENTTGKAAKTALDPVKKWTYILLGLITVLLLWYLVSDRLAPSTSQARVHALVVPVAPEVSGTVISVEVGNNQRVRTGQELFIIDPERYQLAVETAEADLQTARQSMGVSSANVDAAEASLISAEANLVRSEKDAIRLRRIQQEDPGAISQRRIESAEASLASARGRVGASRANVEKALQSLGQTGEQNSLILQAQSALAQAQLNLERTVVLAPEDGLVTNVRVNKGNYANASSPQMTFVALDNIWIQADFTENNLGNIRAGSKVRIVFDVLPGQVFSGKVRELGFGVAVDSAPLGSLPTIDNNQSWLRAAQRYPVLVDFNISSRKDSARLRVGSQATVVVLTSNNFVVNLIARLQIWVSSILSYAY